MLTHTLSNGLRIIVCHRPSVGIYMGIAIDAGTRDELPSESGIAHFTEHMTFKGTQRRSPLQIINSLEGVGGELNAFTGKEETVYYCAVEPCHFRRALDLLTDIVFHSTYPDDEMQREADVVCDEIESYNDSPSELIFDEFEAMLFPDHPLGRNILGDTEELRCHTSTTMHSYAQRMYTADRAVVFVSGPINEERTLTKTAKYLSTLDLQSAHTDSTRTKPLASATQTLTINRNVHQAHVMIGGQAASMSDQRRMPLVLLNNILGGPSMNSRLNLSLRERHGLVYTVESSYTGYTDCGVWSIYFGCDQRDVARCTRLAQREMDSLMQHPLSERQLVAAKRQLRGQLALSYDQHEAIATGMGKTFLHSGVYRTAEEIIERIEAITATELQDIAQQTFSNLSTLIFV